MSTLEAVLGQRRARDAVDKQRQKIVSALSELESAHDLTGLKNQGAPHSLSVFLRLSLRSCLPTPTALPPLPSF